MTDFKDSEGKTISEKHTVVEDPDFKYEPGMDIETIWQFNVNPDRMQVIETIIKNFIKSRIKNKVQLLFFN